MSGRARETAGQPMSQHDLGRRLIWCITAA
jgi:hypothetical protein